jgi:predicted Zn-dependent protease
MGALGSVLGYGSYGYPAYSGYGVYDYFPTWGVSNYSSWGLGSLAYNSLYSGYTNPYYATVVAAQPQQTTVVYDYLQPINVTAAPANPATADSTEQVFSAARDAFKVGDYQRALDLTDQVLKDTPNVPVVHEFRGLCLFALRRFDEAAAVEYAVLSAGPGLNWTTLVGLYPDVDTYTSQIRALEASVRSNPNSPATQFLLGYHYLVQGHQDEAASRFENVTKLQPTDQLSASFVKALKKVSEPTQQAPAQVNVASKAQPAEAVPATAPAQAEPAGGAPGQPAAVQPEQVSEPPPPPPASLVGTWKAQPSGDLSITLSLQADGQFSWEVDTNGQKQTLTGQAGFKDGTLALLQEEGPPLVGKVTEEGGIKFVFSPPSGQKAQGLRFTKSLRASGYSIVGSVPCGLVRAS